MRSCIQKSEHEDVRDDGGLHNQLLVQPGIQPDFWAGMADVQITHDLSHTKHPQVILEQILAEKSSYLPVSEACSCIEIVKLHKIV